MIKPLVLFLFISNSLCALINFQIIGATSLLINATFSEPVINLQYNGNTDDTIADFNAIRKSTGQPYTISFKIFNVFDAYVFESPGIMYNDFTEISSVGLCATRGTIVKFRDFACSECDTSPTLGSNSCRSINGCVNCTFAKNPFEACPLSPFQAIFGPTYCELGNKTAITIFDGKKQNGPKILCEAPAPELAIQCLDPTIKRGWIRRARCLILSQDNPSPSAIAELFEPINNPTVSGVLEVSSTFFKFYVKLGITDGIQLFSTTIGFTGGLSTPTNVNNRFDPNKAITLDKKTSINYFTEKDNWCIFNSKPSCLGGIRSIPTNTSIEYWSTIATLERISYETPKQSDVCEFKITDFGSTSQFPDINGQYTNPNLLSIIFPSFEYKKECEQKSCLLCSQTLSCGTPNCSLGKSVFEQCGEGNILQSISSTIQINVYIPDSGITGIELTTCNLISVVANNPVDCTIDANTNQGTCPFTITSTGNGTVTFYTPHPLNGIINTTIICNQPPTNTQIKIFIAEGVLEPALGIKLCDRFTNLDGDLIFNCNNLTANSSIGIGPPIGAGPSPDAPKTPRPPQIPKDQIPFYVWIIAGIVVVLLIIISLPIILGATQAIGSTISSAGEGIGLLT